MSSCQSGQSNFQLHSNTAINTDSAEMADSLMVRISGCGRDNPGSNPGHCICSTGWLGVKHQVIYLLTD